MTYDPETKKILKMLLKLNKGIDDGIIDKAYKRRKYRHKPGGWN